MEDEDFKDTETTTLIGKHIPISASILFDLRHQPVLLCDPNPRDLVSSFVDALEKLAAKSNAQMQMKFLQIETAIRRLARILEALNQRRNYCVGIAVEDDNSENGSTVPTDA